MKKVEKIFKDFIKNIGQYVNYLMKVDFRELFINVLILICILVLSIFAYIPINVVKDLLLSFILIFGGLPEIVMSLYSWIFDVIGIACSTLAFIYLFNKRFEDIEELKKQINEKPVDKDKEEKTDELVLPKAKKGK